MREYQNWLIIKLVPSLKTKNKTSFNGEDLNYNVRGAALGMMDLKKSSSSIIMTTMVGRA